MIGIEHYTEFADVSQGLQAKPWHLKLLPFKAEHSKIGVGQVIDIDYKGRVEEWRVVGMTLRNINQYWVRHFDVIPTNLL